MMLDMEIAYSATFSTAHGFFFLLNCRREQVYHNEAINAKHIDQTIFKRDVAYRTKFSTTSVFFSLYWTVDVNECITMKPCRNGGTCQNIDGSYLCQCKEGWTDPDCTTGRSHHGVCLSVYKDNGPWSVYWYSIKWCTVHTCRFTLESHRDHFNYKISIFYFIFL